MEETLTTAHRHQSQMLCLYQNPLCSSSKTAQRQALTAWRGVLFTDFIFKCDCSFPDKFFVTGRFQVGFVLDKSEIALYCDLALSMIKLNKYALLSHCIASSISVNFVFWTSKTIWGELKAPESLLPINE